MVRIKLPNHQPVCSDSIVLPLAGGECDDREGEEEADDHKSGLCRR